MDVWKIEDVHQWLSNSALPDLAGMDDEELEDLAEKIDTEAREAGFLLCGDILEWLQEEREQQQDD